MKFTFALASALLSASAFASSHDAHKRLHEHHKMSVNASAVAHQKRFTGIATYFAVGLGACGKFNKASDFIVALNTPQYGGGSPGPQCGKSITISARGKTANAVIMDECPPCKFGSLDLSQGLFEHFADTSEGIFEMSWSFNGGGGGGGGGGDDDDDKPKPKPTTKKHVEPKPTSHTPEPKPTTAQRQKPTTTSKPKTSSKTTSKHVPTSAAAPSAPASQNLRQLNEFVINANNLLQFAAKN